MFVKSPAMLEDTRPTQRLSQFQAIPAAATGKRRRKSRRFLPVLLFIVIAYFLAPLRINILLLGTDVSPERGSVGRTDTILLTTVVPLKPYVGMLSIPRDLWVHVPSVGEQRINTAYFFAEANQPGSGPEAALAVIRQNFDVPVRYYAVIHRTSTPLRSPHFCPPQALESRSGACLSLSDILPCRDSMSRPGSTTARATTPARTTSRRFGWTKFVA
ncbi:MAG: LCP family protein [Anaerolineales bacterium]|nr:LCP family protein [Anaerolineales bacterium]